MDVHSRVRLYVLVLCIGVMVVRHLKRTNPRESFNAHVLGQSSWLHCDTRYKNRTNSLFMQLFDLRNALERCRALHWVDYGTLLGAIRSHSMNPYEVDNDVTIPRLLNARCRDSIRISRLTIVSESTTNGYRLCRTRRGRIPIEGHSPFQSYFPYTDIYIANNTSKIVRVPFGSTYMYAPVNASAYLQKLYGPRWMSPPNHSKHIGGKTMDPV